MIYEVCAHSIRHSEVTVARILTLDRRLLSSYSHSFHDCNESAFLYATSRCSDHLTPDGNHFYRYIKFVYSYWDESYHPVA